MQSNLQQLTAFNNHYYRSSTGQQASQFILDTVSAVSLDLFSSHNISNDSFYTDSRKS